ncbi:DUF4249 domain-containing protein [Marinilabilia rubra]|uniref:DUF4249 domain-containing protein n=1 Tax=Marinilabilia rubra TaxID=2162893 RepID=A0A2U2BAW2_9BACT|nr:DUF4249 domain-containing protein [Marinilabilia rubra]PWE00198.1 DUF4249 domain-containing protein [Marinilabilia rubra]
MTLRKILSLSTLIAIIAGTSCERVQFDPDIDELNERLPVVDAVLGNHPDYKTITLTRTAPYMDGTEVEKIENALVKVNGPSKSYIFDHQKDGIYQAPENFAPVTGGTYNLSIELEGQVYEATSTMNPPVNIDTLLVDYDRWEDPQDHIYEVTGRVKDNESEGEHFIFKYAVNEFLYDSTSVWSHYTDQLTNNTWLDDAIIFMNIEAQPGDTLDVFGLSISEVYYDFIQAAEKNRIGHNPFSPPSGIPITGNISNGALGIFQVSAIVQERLFIPEEDENRE